MTARAILRIGNGLFVGRGLDFQTLDCFRMNEFCIYTLGRNIRHLTVVGVALDKALDDTLAAVPDPVIVEASEKYRNVAGVDDVKVFRGIYTETGESLISILIIVRIPDVPAVGIFRFMKLEVGIIRHNENALFPVRLPDRVDQVDYIVNTDISDLCGNGTDRYLRHESCRFAGAVSTEECLFRPSARPS